MKEVILLKTAITHTNSVQKTLVKITLTLAVTVVMFVVGAVSASAVSAAQEKLVEFTDRSLTVEAVGITYDTAMKSYIKTAKTLNEAFGVKTDRAKAMALTDDEISGIAKRISQNAKIYPVVLEDGNATYYIAVDFRNDDSKYLYNPLVLRQTTAELLGRTEKLSAKRADVKYLMDYTHMVGELKTHFMGYRFSKNLGGENSKGLIGLIYRSCSVADLNIDEDRFPVVIRLFGVVVG